MSMLPGWSRAESGALVFDEASALREVNADLLAALEQALVVMESVADTHGYDTSIGAVPQARAAIAKAGGAS